MKMKPEHYDQLKSLFAEGQALVPPLEIYLHTGNSAMRWRWDCLWKSNKQGRNDFFRQACKYLSDSHIDTALRKLSGTK